MLEGHRKLLFYFYNYYHVKLNDKGLNCVTVKRSKNTNFPNNFKISPTISKKDS